MKEQNRNKATWNKKTKDTKHRSERETEEINEFLQLFLITSALKSQMNTYIHVTPALQGHFRGDTFLCHDICKTKNLKREGQE